MNLPKLCLALAVGGSLTLQAACGSSGTAETTGGTTAGSSGTNTGKASSSGGSAAGTGTGAAVTGTGTGTGAAPTGTGTASGGTGTGGSSSGGTTGGAPTVCNVDTDCPCGDVCSWAQSTHLCVLASTGDPGWCDGTPNCLYQGQTCSGTSCTPAWTQQSVCNSN
jgi:hypothetical protein